MREDQNEENNTEPENKDSRDHVHHMSDDRLVSETQDMKTQPQHRRTVNLKTTTPGQGRRATAETHSMKVTGADDTHNHDRFGMRDGDKRGRS